MRVEFEDGCVPELEALVDTGAEIKIIHPRYVPKNAFAPSKRPLRLGMANAVRLQGGKREVTFMMRIKGREMDSKREVELRIPTTAYDGEMVCEMILSYAWLAQQDAQINPRRHGLLFTERNRTIWVDGLLTGK